MTKNEMPQTLIRPVLLLETEPLMIYAFESIFKDRYRFQTFKSLTDLMSVAGSKDPGFYFSFINISSVPFNELSTEFNPESDAIGFTMFYSSDMDSKILAERIHYLLSIRARALALEATPQMLKYAVSCLESNIQFYCRKVTEFLLNKVEMNEQAQTLLSTRESEVLKELAKGKSSKQIANDLNIGIRTIEAHRQKIMKKLNTSNAAQCIQEANRLKLLE